ncbi:MAG: nucleotidyltransferase family protein [Lachnospiraceae bacterium]|nr:nucleotidyltransferase family protein [Lachnospiraceae bacterium]MCM1239452.1 nucleotidyltransferase family protein [Lachnospiraceae bacterium]
MERAFRTEQLYVMQLLKEALTEQKNLEEDIFQVPVDWFEFIKLAENHNVLSLLYDVLEERKDLIPPDILQRTQEVSKRVAMQSYHLLFVGRYLVSALEKAGITVILLKGVGTASLYPVPEVRKTGDIDLLLPEMDRLEEACQILEENGCRKSDVQNALHHIQFYLKDAIEIELHTMLVEPFDNNEINEFLRQTQKTYAEHLVRTDAMGVEIPMLTPGYHAYELLLHMLQHFLRSGFGLKLLCDWVVLWNRIEDPGERENYLRLVTESRLKGFSDAVTEVCCRFLGLRREAVQWMKVSYGETQANEFMAEILEAEEFGKSSKDRMVALRGTGLTGYAREFHHQMSLNYPKASKCIVCWPVLWAATLARFLYNNRKIRHVSVRTVLKKAGKRGKVIEQMRLWKN